jgi:hypothetical protein
MGSETGTLCRFRPPDRSTTARAPCFAMWANFGFPSSTAAFLRKFNRAIGGQVLFTASLTLDQRKRGSLHRPLPGNMSNLADKNEGRIYAGSKEFPCLCRKGGRIVAC